MAVITIHSCQDKHLYGFAILAQGIRLIGYFLFWSYLFEGYAGEITGN